MDKQPKLIDAEKLLEWMTTNPEAEGFWNDENVVGVNMAYEALQSAIDIGSFDPDPIPPTIKQGDKVRLTQRDYGVGVVLTVNSIYASVLFSNGDPIFDVYKVCLLEDLEVSNG